ncbi:PD-(D/E)XK nuclease superfamily protein [Mariniflexile fucanivorans]|uniref:PD-(D/E)XK nuclease superfamily protein n=2 Tax=Mariniflexile fucanivorans TaxID=264023 RepID=A0A4V2QET4_9FLAO|nr:PD-(D/E)XK nuclease superfamily protein [Mariniflexile fucanivorans]
MFEVEKILIFKTKTILEKQKKYLKDSGEDFNIFSITKIERYENNTHSAMITELLNPKGSHHQGVVFLEEFIKVIFPIVYHSNDENCEVEKKITEFINAKPIVFQEKSIGIIDLDESTGGRIDILIQSDKINIIIENKIDARDQLLQLERYNNYKPNSCLIFYLNLWGNEAPNHSAGKLLANQDYYPISYHYHIIEWLEKCVEKCDNEYVKINIRQYLNLVKKITNQLKDEFMDELERMLISNLLEAEQVANTFPVVKKRIREEFRKKFETALSKRIPKELEFNIDSKNTYLELPNFKNEQLCFAIMYNEGEPVHYGIYNHTANIENVKMVQGFIKGTVNTTNHFPIWEYLKELNGEKIDFNDVAFLSNLMDADNYEKILNKTVNEVSEFIQKYFQILRQI